jgi:hypothetical protein
MQQQEHQVIGKTRHPGVFPIDTLSIIKLLLYTPVGLIVLLARLLMLLVLYLALISFPSLNSSAWFIWTLTMAYGLHVNCHPGDIQPQSSNKKTILITNHITCFDFLVLKSVCKNLTWINSNPNDSCRVFNRILYPSHSTAKMSCKVENINFPSGSDERLFLYFPENVISHGPLKFNFDPFNSITNFEQYIFVPVCLSHRRFFVDLGNHPDNLTNVILTLFTPLTQITVNQLDADDNKSQSEGLNEFANRIQTKIGCFLDSKFPSSKTVTISDDRFDKLTTQIQSVLPHLNANLIKDFLATSESMDVDTIITGLLDKYANVILPDVKTATSNKQTPVAPKRYMTYQERKKMLLEEARSRLQQRNKEPCF